MSPDPETPPTPPPFTRFRPASGEEAIAVLAARPPTVPPAAPVPAVAAPAPPQQVGPPKRRRLWLILLFLGVLLGSLAGVLLIALLFSRQPADPRLAKLEEANANLTKQNDDLKEQVRRQQAEQLIVANLTNLHEELKSDRQAKARKERAERVRELRQAEADLQSQDQEVRDATEQARHDQVILERTQDAGASVPEASLINVRRIAAHSKYQAAQAKARRDATALRITLLKEALQELNAEK
jgi:hypothetical protein